MTQAKSSIRELWGHRVVDPYAWLEDSDAPEVREFLEAENQRTEEALESQAELRNSIFEEIRSRVQETDLSVPVRKDQWLYYTRTEEEQQYSIHCRRPVDAAEGQGEEILLDENTLADGHDYFDLGIFEVTVQHDQLLFGIDTDGDEKYELFRKNLASGEVSAAGPENVSTGSAWALDGKSFFYILPDETNRPSEAWLHNTTDGSDQLVYAENDRKFFLWVGRESDNSFIQIGVGSAVTQEIRVVPADDPSAVPVVIEPRHYGREYSVAHHNGLFLILTNHEAQNFRLMTAPVDSPGLANWEELIPHRDDVMLPWFDVFAHHLVMLERSGGSLQLRVRSFAESPKDEPLADHIVEQPESIATVWPGANPEFETTTLRYGYSSMVTPSSVFAYDMADRERTLLKQQPVLGEFSASDYETRRVWVTAEDGERVPMSLVWKSGRAANPGPALLYGYGAYEASMDPYFSVARLSLLDRGFVFAIAHVRGGGEMGRRWYEAGKFEHKVNSFTDFVCCAQYLISEGWTTPTQLGIRGGSAGGLLVGAALNLAPELFGAVVAEVPFVDVMNTMIDTSQQLTEIEWDEWGNPLESEAVYDVIAGYTPYENIKPVPYPPILATAGISDPRVGYWEPAKWVLRLRDETTGDARVMLRTEMGAGHFGSTARHDSWRDEARVLAFLISELA